MRIIKKTKKEKNKYEGQLKQLSSKNTQIIYN